MIRRLILIAALVFIGFDVARITISGVFLAGVVFLLVAGYLYGATTAAFWIADDELSERLDRVDQEISR